jgi:hypothetical protein
MKMVKKCIIALAVVTLLVTVVNAQEYETKIKHDKNQWPWEYKKLNLCKMPVYMQVGHYVQIKDCGDYELIVEQIPCEGERPEGIGKGSGDFPCFTGCEEIKVRANFPAILGASLENKASLIDKSSLFWKDDKKVLIGGGSGDAWETFHICLDLWKVKMWQAGAYNSKLKIADVVINVKPPES